MLATPEPPRADGVELRCSHCPACCRQVRVPLTHVDLARLVAATNLPSASVGEWLAPGEVDMEGEPQSFVVLDVGRRLLVLRHSLDGCRYLSSEGLCDVYQARPSSCAAYPYGLDVTDGKQTLTVLSDAPCSKAGASEHLRSPEATAEARAAAERVEIELRAYWSIVERWNHQQRRRKLAGRKPRSRAEFFAYLALLEQPQPGVTEA